MTTSSFCHCGSLLTEQQCCQIFIDQVERPKTAEQLMRSRFTAFKLKKYQYLIKTSWLKPNERPIKVSDFDNNSNWLGLKVISTIDGNDKDQTGIVEFVAFYQPTHHPITTNFSQLHERSYFERINGNWLYISGNNLPSVKLSRNEACFCASGKKFKKCHGI